MYNNIYSIYIYIQIHIYKYLYYTHTINMNMCPTRMYGQLEHLIHHPPPRIVSGTEQVINKYLLDKWINGPIVGLLLSGLGLEKGTLTLSGKGLRVEERGKICPGTVGWTWTNIVAPSKHWNEQSQLLIIWTRWTLRKVIKRVKNAQNMAGT